MANQKLPGLTRSDEEWYLQDTIAVAQRNLERAKSTKKQLAEEMDELREQVNSTGDKEGLFLWNNAKAQLRDAINEITRYEKARKKPYFGRIDFRDVNQTSDEAYYIGRVGIARTPEEPIVIDWRAPIASVYYENAIGRGTYTVSSEGTFEIDLKRKRSYEIEDDQLKDFYDLDVVANDELLTKYLSKNKTEVLGEIIATIQKEQNQIIRRSPKTNMIVQGAAGSGKTTVAMHRISYILYNYENDFRPQDFYIIGSNRILLNYITGVLPELDVYGVQQMTMEQLFIRLLYEDWDDAKYSWHEIDKNDVRGYVKGKRTWFCDLEAFCREYETANISHDPVYMEKTGTLLLGPDGVSAYLASTPLMSMQSKRLMLNEIIFSKYENEIMGRNVSFLPEEKKALDKKYSFYYGKDEWKGSVFELYHEFLLQQIGKGYDVDVPENSFDVYDLAALAYLYKRIKEIDPIREATHIVIDEAQDFGMMAYCCLHYCIRGCTYTIMGDTSQNIHYEYGLNDWSELRELVLTGVRDRFGLLQKSYRNTVEISHFATEILRHGDFAIYPVEPIIRHGNEVRVKKVSSKDLIAEAVETITGWQRDGYETIAVVCRDEEEASAVAKQLGTHISIKEADPKQVEFGSGVMVLPVVYTKGLEFDAVLVFDPTEDKYPADNAHVKMLYVTATRALHELTILSCGNLSPLIATKAPEDRHSEELQVKNDWDDEFVLTKPTKKEVIAQDKRDGDREMAARNYMGPQRIKLKEEQLVGKAKEEAKSVAKALQTAKAVPSEKTFAYGSMPDNQMLPVRGHAKADCAIRWVKKTKTGLELTSRYGVLTLTPVMDACVRVSFAKETGVAGDDAFAVDVQKGLKWSAKESPSVVELATAKIILHIEKKSGAVTFLAPDRKPLLSEKAAEPRLVDGGDAWNFFDFDKKEKLKSKGILSDDLMELSMKARYISFGGKQPRMPLVVSNKGYGIGVASFDTTLFCGIPSYGPYIRTWGNRTDYFFLHAGSTEQNIRLYTALFSKIGK